MVHIKIVASVAHNHCVFQSLHCQLEPPDIFGHWELLDALNQEHQELGLIIDLTFTTRYYNIDVFDVELFMHDLPSHFQQRKANAPRCVHCVVFVGCTGVAGVSEDLHKGTRSPK